MGLAYLILKIFVGLLAHLIMLLTNRTCLAPLGLSGFYFVVAWLKQVGGKDTLPFRDYLES